MWAILTGKIGAIAFMAATAGLLIILAVMWFRLGDAQSERDAARAEINTPVTGFRARLETCQHNTAGMKVALDELKRTVDDLKAEAARRTAEAQARIRAAQARALAAERKVAALQSSARRPNETACAHGDRLFDEVTR